MMKKLMFLVAMVAGLFASCTDNTVLDNKQDEGAKKMKLSINASVAGSRVGFTPNGEGLKGSFQEGDYMMVYFRKADGGCSTRPACSTMSPVLLASSLPR